MRKFLAKNASWQKLFLVTHQVNIWALAGTEQTRVKSSS